MSEQITLNDEPMNSVRGFASGLVEDSRDRGYRGYTADQLRDLLGARFQAIIKMLKSDDLKAINRGLRALATIEKGWQRVLDVETQYAKTGVEAATAYELVRTRMQAETGQRGPSPENMSEAMSRMMAEIQEQDKVDDPGPSPEAETTPEPAP